MYPYNVECFMCANDYKCIVVNDKIITQVEYLLPEITIIKKSIPLRICAICERSLQSFCKFKDISVKNNLRLEARLKEAQGVTNNAAQSSASLDFEHLIDSAQDKSVTSRLKEHKFEDTVFLAKIIKTALCSKDSSSSNIQLQPNSFDSDNKFEDSVFIQKVIKKIINSVVTEKKTATVNKNTRNVEDISIMEDLCEKTPFDREFYNYIVHNTATEEDITDNNIDGSTDNQIDTKCETEDLIKKAHLKEEDTYDSMDKVEEIFVKEELPEETSIDSDAYNNENTPKEFTEKSANTEIIDNGKKHFQCSICLQIFVRKCAFVVHMTAHNKPKYVKCKECNIYIDKKVLVSHIQTHSEVKQSNCEKKELDREKKDIQCPICDKMFKLKCNLATHIKIHNREKEFRCQICSKLFLLKTHLQDHMEVHNNLM